MRREKISLTVHWKRHNYITQTLFTNVNHRITTTMNDNILFGCSIDNSSERDIIDALLGLNYLVDNFIFNLVISNQLQNSPFSTVPSSALINLDAGLSTFLTEHSPTPKDAWSIAIDFFLRNVIFSLIHTHFFDGNIFFGVGSDIHRQYLDLLMSELIASGMLPAISSPFFFFFLKKKGVISSGRFENIAIQ